ncbi:hypothetical protein [Salinicoccus bachuensis]|uniref:Uncharacterized protein n=1 Tax=Salinicoccus bachuensis TaxID=3136731 RepID=A0ABZ3CKG1_9STAP
MNLFLSIIATGVPGFISYWILSQFRLLDVDKNNKDEKLILLTGLSLINIFVVYLVLVSRDYSFPLESITPKTLIGVALTSMIVVLILSVLIWPLIIKITKDLLNKWKFVLNIPNDSNRTVFDEIMMSRPNETFTQAYIFTFDDKLIIEGATGYISHDRPELSIRNKIDITTTYEQAIKVYNKTDNEHREILIDYERQLKIILIHFAKPKKSNPS